MEQKSIIASKPKNLLLHALLEKKNWVILTLVVLAVSVFILPIMIRTSIHSEFIVLGIIEVCIVVIVNCFIDFNYLHDARKFGYYMSKPISNLQRLHLNYLANGIFAAVFLGALLMVSLVLDHQILDWFLVPVSWLIFIVLLIGLSSQLSGNTIIAALATAFNFALPAIVLGMLYFAMDIVSDIAIGFNVNLIMDYILSNIYRLDYLYIIQYTYDFSWSYFVVMIVVSGFIYLMTRWAIKHRKNERIGEHIMFKGYKYFIGMAFSVLVPFIFTQITNDGDYMMKLVSFILLGAITYYIALIVLDKSFKLKPVAIKILVVFMSIFIVIVAIAGFAILSVERVLPEASEVAAVLVSNSDHVILPMDQSFRRQVTSLEYEDLIQLDLPLYESEDAIEYIIALHDIIVHEDRNKIKDYNSDNLNIIYFMKDGTTVKRYFSIPYSEELRSAAMNQTMKNLMTTDDNKAVRFPIILSETYRNHFKELRFDIDKDERFVLESKADIEGFVAAFKLDLEKYFEIADENIYSIGYNNQYINFPLMNREKVETTQVGEDEYLYVSIYSDDSYVQGFDIPSYFDHTRTFISTIIKEQSQ